MTPPVLGTSNNPRTNIFQYSHQAQHNEELFKPHYRDLPLGFRLFVTTNTRKFAAAGLSAMDVVNTTVLGDEAFAVIDLEAFPPQIIRKERGSGGATGDPLNQIASVGLILLADVKSPLNTGKVSVFEITRCKQASAVQQQRLSEGTPERVNRQSDLTGDRERGFRSGASLRLAA